VQRSFTRLLVAVTLPLSAVAIAGCGSSQSSSTGAAANSPAVSAPAGAPIKFSVLYPATGPEAAPEVLSGAQAAVDAINASGGVALKGGGAKHSLALVPCNADNTTNPSAPADCAKQVLASGVVLDVGKYTLSGTEDDILAKAGVAMLGVNPFSEEDYTNKLSFPFGGAAATLVPGTAAALAHAGASRIVYVSLDIPAAAAAKNFIPPVLHPPAKLVATVLLPTDPSIDLTPYFATIAGDHPDGVILGVPAEEMTHVVAGIRQAGFTGTFAATPFTLTNTAIKALGSSANGILSVSDFASISGSNVPEITAFKQQMRKYEPSAVEDEFSLDSWLSVHEAAEVAGTLTTANAASFAAALQGLRVQLGVAPAFTLGVQHFFLPFPRVSRGTVQYQVVKDGQIVPDGDGAFVDLNALVKH
jgi:ABC-type branched-subunit amino acid transport system substrate-binding protein